jgi:hypothetical protein
VLLLDSFASSHFRIGHEIALFLLTALISNPPSLALVALAQFMLDVELTSTL